MSRSTIGVIDYHLGNQLSVINLLNSLGFKVIFSSNPSHLDDSDILLLPGVGAFPAAMQNLYSTGLDIYLKNAFVQERPLVGICLGMHLLTQYSTEFGITDGLSIFPGYVQAIRGYNHHIGWSTLHPHQHSPFECFYTNIPFFFNHGYEYIGDSSHIIASASISKSSSPIASIIQSKKFIGLQFHPEKSQSAGYNLLLSIFSGLL